MTDYSQRRAAPRFEIQSYVTASFSRSHKRYEAALADISTGGAGFIIEDVGNLVIQPGDKIKMSIGTSKGLAEVTVQVAWTGVKAADMLPFGSKFLDRSDDPSDPLNILIAGAAEST